MRTLALALALCSCVSVTPCSMGCETSPAGFLVTCLDDILTTTEDDQARRFFKFEPDVLQVVLG